MITIFIDNKPHQVNAGQNLLSACLSLGFDLPYFCWHPALHSVGACRQCAVKVFKDAQDAKGRIVMSCMTPVADGMRLSVHDPDARAFRAGVIEWLMLNHPHDCPVCDEGGECHLQDMTVMTGHVYRAARFRKRTHRNQDLGPFINHEMNRCIQCYRCVRYYRGVAGGRDLNVFGSRDRVYFGRHEDGTLESEFSGNLVEICPTGVFTDKTFKKHVVRKWDLQTAPSLCVHCGIGCNTLAAERTGTLRRILNRFHPEVNGYFLCDRGRFGYEFVNSAQRQRLPAIAGAAASGDAAVARVAEALASGGSLAGIGSPRASLESNAALRALVGPANFYSGMAPREHAVVSLMIDVMRSVPARIPSLREVQNADAVFVLGEDVSNTAPLLALALRQAARNSQRERAAGMNIPSWDDNATRTAGQEAPTPFIIATSAATRLDDVATRTCRASTAEIAGLGFAVAHSLHPEAPQPALPPALRGLAAEIAEALKAARRPLIVSGSGCLSESVVRAASNIARALAALDRQPALCFAVPECNSLGLGLMEARPIDELAARKSDVLIILENDLFRRQNRNVVEELLARAKHVIVLDHLHTPTTERAGIVLPAATFAESIGTLVNFEGRAQRFYQVFQPGPEIRAGWHWISAIMKAAGSPLATEYSSYAGVLRALSAAHPDFSSLPGEPVQVSASGMKLKIPRMTHRASGRTAVSADSGMHEPRPPEDVHSALAFSMEGFDGRPPAPLIARYWSPGWNSVQALNKFQQELGGALTGSGPGVRLLDSAAAAAHQETGPAYFPAGVAGPEEPLSAPQYRVFGSEELSAAAPSIRARMREAP